MPLVFNKQFKDQDSKLGVWEITESLEQLEAMIILNESDQTKFSEIKVDSRKKQWLVARILLKQLSENSDISVVYDEEGRPYTSNDSYHISISHTEKFVSVILNSEHQVGIDIEKFDERVARVQHKFLSDKEAEYISNLENPLESLTLIWSAKEALFKMNRKANMDFRKNISIEKFEIKDEGQLEGEIKRNGCCNSYSLGYVKIRDHILVYAIAAN